MSTNDLSPWAHSKSQEWFETILKRSGFMTGVENFLSQPVDKISPGQCRMVLMFLIILGRRGIWPTEYNDILELVESKVSGVLDESETLTHKKMTLSEHQLNTSVLHEIQQELEILRRRVGKSRLKAKVGKPKTWREFWN